MYAYFTKKARKVINSANMRACRFGHEYIGTEHLLLALVKDGGDICKIIFKVAGISSKKIEAEIKKIITMETNNINYVQLPQTPRAKKAIKYAVDETAILGHKNVCTHHLLLGLLCEYDGIASQILINFGLDLEEVRKKVLNLHESYPEK